MLDIVRDADDICTIAQIALRLQVRAKTVYEWAKPLDKDGKPKRHLETFKAGGCIRSTWRAVQAFVQSRDGFDVPPAVVVQQPQRRRNLPPMSDADVLAEYRRERRSI